MLCGMVQQNFVNFKDRLVFDFSKNKNGPSLFVGASSTGKTAALELIRRCMDDKLNSSLTTRYNQNKKAFVFCKFYIHFADFGHTVITGMVVEKNKETGNKRETEKRDQYERKKGKEVEKMEEDQEDEDWNERNKTMFHKIMIYFYRKKIKICSKTYLEKQDGNIADCRKNVMLDERKLDFTIMMDRHGNLTKKFEDIFNDAFVEKALGEIKRLQKKNMIYTRYPKLWGLMEEQFVGVLPTRGLGTIQWTKSQFIDNRFKSMNYEGTCAHAEIINKLLDSTSIEKSKEQEIFRFLTDSNDIVFERKPSCSNDSVQIVVRRGNTEFPLLKTSVGVIEAKQFSLLVAHNSFKTICLEEPDRGMHPHMIERMREVLHKESRSKTFIVVTHSPYLLDSRSIENTSIFFKNDKTACARNIRQLTNINFVRKIIEVEDLKRILFSSHVLFVEGKSDKIVVQSILRQIFKDPRTTQGRQKKLSYEIISLGGKCFRDSVATFCNSIEMKYCFLLDRDAHIDTKLKKVIGYPKLSSYDNLRTFLDNEFDSLSEHLAKEKRTFIWKHGDLENFLLSDKNATLKIQEALELEGSSKIDIKKSLNAGLSVKQSEELAEVIKDFHETKRLLRFLEKFS